DSVVNERFVGVTGDEVSELLACKGLPVGEARFGPHQIGDVEPLDLRSVSRVTADARRLDHIHGLFDRHGAGTVLGRGLTVDERTDWMFLGERRGARVVRHATRRQLNNWRWGPRALRR